MSKNKRKSGRNKSRAFQRDYQRHVRAELGSGKVNDPNGNWIPISMIFDGKVRDRAEKIAPRMRP